MISAILKLSIGQTQMITAHHLLQSKPTYLSFLVGKFVLKKAT